MFCVPFSDGQVQLQGETGSGANSLLYSQSQRQGMACHAASWGKHLGGQQGVRGEVQAGAFVGVSGEEAGQGWAGSVV